MERIGTKYSVIAVTAFIVVLGAVLGLALDPSNDNPAPWDRISAVIGWIYFAAWSVSFYPQTVLNWRRKSVVGMSLDYQVYNIIGFSCYTVFNVSFFWVRSIQDAYEERFHKRNVVEPNDVFFAIHAVVLTLVTLFQATVYTRGKQRVSWLCIGLSALFCVGATGFAVGCVLTNDQHSFFSWLNFVYALSYTKLGISFIKYMPQVYLNYTRGSTVGWNIWNVLLDFTGGALSVAQHLMDCGTTGNWSGITGNPVKFGLGFLSIFFDIIFMLQHYVFFTDRSDPYLHQRLDATSPAPDYAAVEDAPPTSGQSAALLSSV